MSAKDWMKNKLDGTSSNKTYIGAVEDNKDPKKLGRCKVRVFDIFDEKDKEGKYEISVEDLPWATPWRDVNGNNFNLPEVGKVITVMFEDGNKNNPVYVSSDHYNVNLEKKLEQLPEADYLSMKALLYDHKTQIYVNDAEGLKIDHKFNNINIKEQSININLKDNFGKVNIGSPNSTQRAILGDNFVNWFDEFLNILMGSKGGPFLGNLLAPVVATPALMAQIQLYFSLKDPKILSKNVYIVDNESVAKQERTEGGAAKGSVSEGQKGDTWQSTVDENKLTTKEPVKFTPVEGASNTTFNKPPENATEPVPPVDLAPEKPTQHPDVDVILEMLRMKKYKIFTKPNELNIVAIRHQCINSGDKYTDEFVDKLYVLWKDEQDNWQIKQYVFSTVPGVEFEVNDNWIKGKNFSGATLEYWTSKKGSKITMKDFYKGPITPPTATDANATGSGSSGTSGTSGSSGSSGSSGTSGSSGSSGSSGTSGGTTGTSGTSGDVGTEWEIEFQIQGGKTFDGRIGDEKIAEKIDSITESFSSPTAPKTVTPTLRKYRVIKYNSFDGDFRNVIEQLIGSEFSIGSAEGMIKEYYIEQIPNNAVAPDGGSKRIGTIVRVVISF
jgi:uncharacterized membrane protein YgcG